MEKFAHTLAGVSAYTGLVVSSFFLFVFVTHASTEAQIAWADSMPASYTASVVLAHSDSESGKADDTAPAYAYEAAAEAEVAHADAIAHKKGLTQEQMDAVLVLLAAFEVDQATIDEVEEVLGDAAQPEASAALSAAAEPVEVLVAQMPAPVPPAAPAPMMAAVASGEEVPDVAGMMASAAAAPWFAAVDSLSEIFYAVGAY